MYLSDLSLSSEGISSRIEESETYSRYNRQRSTRGEKIRRKFHRRMEFFLAKGGPCSYDDESIDDLKVSLRYKNLVKQWVPKDIPQINADFCVNKRIHHNYPSSLHSLGIFSMDGVKVFYDRITEMMAHVGPYYIYKDWIRLVQY